MLVIRVSRRWSAELVLALLCVLVLPACLTNSLLRSLRGGDRTNGIEQAWFTAEGDVEVILSATPRGEYVPGSYHVALKRAELEPASTDGPTAEAQETRVLVLPRERLVRCDPRHPPAPGAGAKRIEQTYTIEQDGGLPRLREGETIVQLHGGDPDLWSTSTPTRFVLLLRDPGSERVRCVQVEIEPDTSPHTAARWTAPVLMPLTLAADVVTVVVLLGMITFPIWVHA